LSFGEESRFNGVLALVEISYEMLTFQ